MSKRLSDLRMRDPFILRLSSGGFVLFGTTDTNLWGGPATGFDCYTSDDLATWEGPIPAFRPPVGFWADTQFWAPEVVAHDDRFFMFATFASTDPNEGPRGVQVLVSDEPTGPFVPWSEGPVTPRDVPCLDGTLFLDDDDVPWLVYSRGAEGVPGGPAGIRDGEMYARRLTDDLTAAAGSPLLLFTASTAPWSKPLWFPEGVEPPEQLNLAKNPLFTDGPFLVRSGRGALFMLWSSFVLPIARAPLPALYYCTVFFSHSFITQPTFARLNAELNRIGQLPQVRDKMLAQGIEMLPPASPAAAQKLVRDDLALWLPIIKASGASAE